MIDIIVGIEYIPRKAMNIKITVSKNCDQILERLDRSQNFFSPICIMKKKKEILFVFFTGALAWVLANALKIFIHTDRPFIALSNVQALFSKTGFSFPSGHATFFMALAVSIFFLHKKAGYIFMFFALLIGIARIIAGIHFPVDILGGFVLGIGVAYLLKNVYPHTYF
jgi:membrane-associated phospholipid phosphatase